MAQLRRRCVATNEGAPVYFPSWLSSDYQVTLCRLKKACTVAVRTADWLDEKCMEIILNDGGGFV